MTSRPSATGRARRTHSAQPENPGRLQQPLLLLCHSLRARAQPQLAAGAVLAEIRRLARAGYKEVVLSGINLGSYGRDLAPRADLGELIRQILGETPLERLRLSSIEPRT